MRTLTKILALSTAALAVSGSALAASKHDPAEELAKLLEGRVAGPPVSCINLPQAQGSRVINHTAIVYDFGTTIYVNYPRGGADSLSSDDILVTKTPGTQLCKMDIVRMVDRSVGFPKGFVSLGPFIPYKRVAAAK
ncbi:MAG TPA: hypothetical protein VK519_14160 [Pinirhizobacter sp.]|uniref:hypothetical protein n=1 Tax=Pinirhizobacter sp. TaxID=2950432 RepID=UPI002C6E35AC|nr:hypothetical protein [Pinirhizobacter sp.]HMH69053.1 hypothetical protein [Pinirhizobacter sp.]